MTYCNKNNAHARAYTHTAKQKNTSKTKTQYYNSKTFCFTFFLSIKHKFPRKSLFAVTH